MVGRRLERYSPEHRERIVELVRAGPTPKNYRQDATGPWPGNARVNGHPKCHTSGH